MIARMRAKGGERWLFEQIAEGRTMKSISDELETSRYELYLFVGKNDRVKQAMRLARAISATAHIEEALRISEGPGDDQDSKVRVARDNLRLGYRKYLAEAFDPDVYGKKDRAGDIVKDIAALHLDALRNVIADQQKIIQANNAQALPPGYRKKEYIVDAEVVEEEQG